MHECIDSNTVTEERLFLYLYNLCLYVLSFIVDEVSQRVCNSLEKVCLFRNKLADIQELLYALDKDDTSVLKYFQKLL